MEMGIPGDGNCQNKGTGAREYYEQHDAAGVSSGPGERCALAGHRPHEGKPPVRSTRQGGSDQEAH